MKILKTIFKNIHSRIWFIVTSVMLILVLVITLILSLNVFIKNTFDSVFGPGKAIIDGDESQYQYFTSDYSSKAETLAKARELNEKISEEGCILLKNDGALPIKTPLSDSNITEKPTLNVYGKASANLVYGGSGSSSTSTNGAATIYESLDAAGYEVNQTLKSFYEDNKRSGNGRPSSPEMGTVLSGFPIGETPKSYFTADSSVLNSLSGKTAALVVVSRIGGEGYDLPRAMRMSVSGEYKDNKDAWGDSAVAVSGAKDRDDHYLQLDKNETEMLATACEYNDNVIIIINAAQPIELGFLDDPDHYAYNSKIKGALWIGNPGYNGINAVGRILNGSITPSGRTVDTFVRDFKLDPSWENFGNNNSYMGNRYLYNNVMSSAYNYYSVSYEEGIYVGYRYWETRFGNDEAEYKKKVVYPLGYDTSYTTFDWQLDNRSALEGKTISADTELEFKVKVENTGVYSGKDVVQIYVETPYTGKIQKASKVLVGFDKTAEIAPNGGEAEALISFNAYDFASYDMSKGCYVLEEGTYTFHISYNAHNQADGVHNSTVAPVTMTVSSGGIEYDKDPVTKTKIKNLFSDVADQLGSVYSRSNWDGTKPVKPSEAERNMPAEFFSSLNYTLNDEGKPWKVSEEKMPATGAGGDIMLYDLINKPFAHEDWDKLLDRISIKDMQNLIGTGNYNTAAISNIEKPRTTDPDGPGGFTNFLGDASVYDTCFYACECVLAASWSAELAYEMGRMVGNEGIWGDDAGKGANRPYSGWYAPAVNIHRSQFSGRNWEYYSEDSLLSGKMAANVCAGAKSKGVYTYVKHFALNDQESNRDANGLLTWADEQTMREIYLKPFEFAVKEGGTNAMMSSFNRIGTTWAGGSYALLTELLRGEWGFEGMVITDYKMGHKYMPVEQMIRAGGDIMLNQDDKPSAANDATQVSAMRRATKNILFVVVNSCGMNGIGDETTIKYSLANWQIFMIVTDCIIVTALAIWGVFAIISATKREKDSKN